MEERQITEQLSFSTKQFTKHNTWSYFLGQEPMPWLEYNFDMNTDAPKGLYWCRTVQFGCLLSMHATIASQMNGLHGIQGVCVPFSLCYVVVRSNFGTLFTQCGYGWIIYCFSQLSIDVVGCKMLQSRQDSLSVNAINRCHTWLVSLSVGKLLSRSWVWMATAVLRYTHMVLLCLFEWIYSSKSIIIIQCLEFVHETECLTLLQACGVPLHNGFIGNENCSALIDVDSVLCFLVKV